MENSKKLNNFGDYLAEGVDYKEMCDYSTYLTQDKTLQESNNFDEICEYFKQKVENKYGHKKAMQICKNESFNENLEMQK